MSMYNRKQAPYYDKYDWSKGQIQLLAVPGRVAQAREFTEIQSALRHIIKSVGDSVMKNGDIIEGCQVIVSKETKTVKVTPGKVYMDGMVLPIETNYKETDSDGNVIAEYATVSIKAEEYLKEVIGIKIDENVITEDIDEETGQDLMKDPAQGYDNYNQPGCHRLRRVLKVVVDDPEAAPIATLIAGDMMVETYAPEYDTLVQTLARRTHDESGSYIVNGLKVGMEPISPGQELDDYYNITVDSGKAYILGYELGIPTTRRIRVRRATYAELKSSVAAHYYQGNRSEYQIENRPYVASIQKVQAQALRENHRMDRNLSSNASEDKLPSDFSGRFLDRVWSGDVEYEEGVNYTLNEGGTTGVIKWIEGADAPTGTYYINYRYSHTYLKDVDYSLDNRSDGSYLVWLDPSDTNKHPAENEPLTIEYKIYLARKDIVYIDKEGNIDVLEGKPSIYGSENLPETPINTLVLANISNPPNGTARVTSTTDLITVSNVGLTRFTMHDIQRLLDRIQTMEYDQAVLTLNDDAKKVYTVNDKRGVWTEPFIDLSRIDFNYNLDGNKPVEDHLPIHDMALDLVSNIGYLPVIATKHDLIIDKAPATPEEYKYSRLLSLANVSYSPLLGGEQIVRSQLRGTTTFQVNPYSTFPQIPEIIIDPAVDSWYDDTIIEIPVSLNNTEVVKLSSKSLDLRLPSMKNNSNWATRTRTYTKDTAIGTKTDTLISESIISESAVTYIRPRTIHVEGIDFTPGLDNIEGFFDGVRVELRSDRHAGGDGVTRDGTVFADEFGTFQAEFDIPEGRLTGTREVLFKSKSTINGVITEASALYVAQGIARQIERTVTTVNTVLVKRVERSLVTAVYVDPIGQSFVLDRMTLISGVDVYFSAKAGDLSNIPILCEIRGVTNGTIDGTVYASKSLLPSEIEVDSEFGEKATRFRFDNPVLLEGNTQYAFTLRSLSDSYRVWVSELGGTDVVTGNTVVRNESTGVMFSSSNNATWTPHQTTDMKFRLIADGYNSTTEYTFQDIYVENAARLYLTADSVIPTGTAADWSYKLGEDGAWQSIVPYNLAFIKEGYTGPISLRLNLSREVENGLSPLVAIDTLSLEESHYVKKGCYISKSINNLDPYDEVQVILDWYNAPKGHSTLKVSISTDDGETLQVVSPTKVDESNPASSDKETELGNGWVEKYYKLKLDAKATKCKVFIEFSNSTGPEEVEVTYSTPAIRRLRCTMS